jgi:GTP cyclohydrolase II
MKKMLAPQVSAQIPTRFGLFKMIAFADSSDEHMPHIAYLSEKLSLNAEKIVPVRIHSECMTGDVFGSRRCDCGEQLTAALKMVATNGGILIYLRQEGRGIGLINKLKAYNLQDGGLNTADANTHLGFEIDARQYDAAISILEQIGVRRIALITNNPLKVEALRRAKSLEIMDRIPLVIQPNSDNLDYFQTKKALMGHFL